MELKEKELREAYSAGLSKHNSGANETNCHFRFFNTKARMKAWEAGAAAKPFVLKEILLAAL